MSGDGQSRGQDGIVADEAANTAYAILTAYPWNHGFPEIKIELNCEQNFECSNNFVYHPGLSTHASL
jgi:hypothetical protein